MGKYIDKDGTSYKSKKELDAAIAQRLKGGAKTGGARETGGGLTTSVPPIGTPAVSKSSDTQFPLPYVTGAAVPAKPTDLKQATTETIYNAGEEAKRLTIEEEKRGGAATDLTAKAVEEANVPTLDDQDISLAFGQDVDANAPDFLAKMGQARDYFGGAGITGGGVQQGLATQFELGRLGQNTDAKRSLFLEKAKTDSLDRVRNFQNQMSLATQMQRPVAMEWSDFLQGSAGIDLAREGFASAEKQAKTAGKATEKAGKNSALGNVFGAIF